MTSPTDRPSRRQILTGRVIPTPESEAHISSLVVHVRPEKAAGVRSALAQLAGVEFQAEAAGKIIITLETATESDIVDRMNRISLLDGVMSAALVFHHFESADQQGPAASQG